MIIIGPPQVVVFNFSDRRRVVEKYKEWVKYQPMSDCPETFMAWLFIKDYLDLDKIKEDLKDDDEI